MVGGKEGDDMSSTTVTPASTTDVPEAHAGRMTALEAAARRMPATATLDDLVGLAGRARRFVDEHTLDALTELADVGSPAGAVLIHDLPVGDVPATPLRPGAPTGKDRVSELVLLTAARLLGQPVGYRPEHGGQVVQDIIPTPEAARRQVSTSSDVELAFHTETAFHRHKPRYLLLLCLRGDPAAATTLCSVHDVLAGASPRTREVLAEPRFRIGVDESFTGERTAHLSEPIAVLGGTPSEPSLTFDADLMVGVDGEAQAALDEVTAIVAARHRSVTLQRGDLLVIDNLMAVHGRAPFTARFDGTDRWLQRTFVVSDLASSAPDRAGRIVETRVV
jgi:L-asparagine oxygenase